MPVPPLVSSLIPIFFRALVGEPVELVVDDPHGCLDAHDLAGDVAALGAPVRAPSRGERARRFEVTIAPAADRWTARLAVRDLVGREAVRAVDAATCDDAARSAALLVSLAVDEPAEPEPEPRPTPTYWPAPAGADEDCRRAPAAPRGRLGSGGLVVTATYGWWNGRGTDTPIAGARVYAGWRVPTVTRIGATIAVAREDRIDTGSWSANRGTGTSGRAGAIVGWGAPWNDSVAGFVGEIGVYAGETHETATYATFTGGARTTSTDRLYASPYAGSWLVLQLPWNAAVRPVAQVGSLYVPYGPDRAESVTFMGEAGVVWQGW